MLFALDPVGLGGVVLRAAAGPVRERWLAELRRVLTSDIPVKAVPLHVHDERLLGGLDLPATLAAGRPIAEPGLLAEADGGVVLLAMAERISPGVAAQVSAALDSGEVNAAREGISQRRTTRFGVIALDEGIGDEGVPESLSDRLAFHLDLSEISPREALGSSALLAALAESGSLERARCRLPQVDAEDAVLHALCAAAATLGIGSMRPPWLALRVASALAAFAGRDSVDGDDTVRAAQLVFGSRARVAPPASAEPPSESPPSEQPPAPSSEAKGEDSPDADPPPSQAEADSAPDNQPADPSGADESEALPSAPTPAQTLDDVVLEAAAAAIPAGLLHRLAIGQAAAARNTGGAGGWQADARRGAPVGVRRTRPRGGQRMNLIATLRAAAPWQRVRRAAAADDAPARLQIRVEDFHVGRFRQRSETTTLFVVDASGSSALNRLAEAKGAVELLLADCYVRRDKVAVLAFRGKAAELLLPPTRSLVRAKRSLAGLPGGGGTPLAAALDATWALADSVRRHGDLPFAVLLTDGRANVARNGQGGRARAEAEALDGARRLRASGLDVLLLDTSPQPQPQAERLAAEMGATYLPLPYAGAAAMSAAVRSLQRTQRA
jgi:magnesium chelatase subunit D